LTAKHVSSRAIGSCRKKYYHDEGLALSPNCHRSVVRFRFWRTTLCRAAQANKNSVKDGGKAFPLTGSRSPRRIGLILLSNCAPQHTRTLENKALCACLPTVVHPCFPHMLHNIAQTGDSSWQDGCVIQTSRHEKLAAS